jgi:long-chain fatty acid transport protein
MTNQFVLLGEVGWANWSSMVDTVVHIYNYSVTTPQNWHDTYRFGLAGQYKATPAMVLQAGASYDSSPTNSTKRLPDLPMDRQIRLGLGLKYALIKAVNLGASYEYINLGQAPINNSSSAGVLSGHYSRNYVNVAQVSLNVEC